MDDELLIAAGMIAAFVPTDARIANADIWGTAVSNHAGSAADSDFELMASQASIAL